MKELVKISNKIENYSTKELIFAGFTHFLCFLCGIMFTRAVVLEKLLPFGISYISGISFVYMPSAVIGVFFGYLFPVHIDSGFRYIAILFAIVSVKILLSQYKKILKNHLLMSFITSIGFLLVSFVSLKIKDITFLEAITESVLCGFSSFFISKCFSVLNRTPSGLSTEELSSLLICLSLLVMGFSSFKFMSVSLGTILSVAIILTSAKYGGITSGAISGISVGLALSLCGNNPNISLALTFSGLVSGIFITIGKYAQVAVLIVFCFIGSVTTSNLELIGSSMVEAIIGSLIFLTLPKNIGVIFGKFFSKTPTLSIPQGFKNSLTMRLELASNALRDVSETVEQVSSELSKINSPDFSNVITAIERDACSGCKLRIHCWETKKEDTINAILQMTNEIKKGNIIPEDSLPYEFKGRCLRTSKLGNSAYKRYSEYITRISAENRIEEVRSVVTDQFNGISMMLKDLSVDFKNDQQFDNIIAENCVNALKNLDIQINEANSRIDKFGRITLEFKIKKTPELIINKLEIIKAVSLVCERNFDIPRITQIGNDIYIIINEKSDIKIDVGIKQLNANNSNICGDSYKFFDDGKGHFIMLLSDGMGTGGRAAVDGAMATGLMSRLLTAGFGFDCSLRILNSSMLFKSTDESLATLDVVNIDLFTGQLKLYKAGAAPTIVRRQGKTGKAESTSLPLGILRNISFDKAAVKCKIGDIIVMMSDGVTSSGVDWIRAEVEAWKDGNAQNLADRICECALRRREEKYQDDMTVLVAILEKAI